MVVFGIWRRLCCNRWGIVWFPACLVHHDVAYRFAWCKAARSALLWLWYATGFDHCFISQDLGQLKLVYEALHERKVLLQNAPHLAHALPILTVSLGVQVADGSSCGLADKLNLKAAGMRRVGTVMPSRA